MTKTAEALGMRAQQALQALSRLIADHPDAPEAEIAGLFWEKCRGDPELLRVIVEEVVADLFDEITGKPRLN